MPTAKTASAVPNAFGTSMPRSTWTSGAGLPSAFMITTSYGPSAIGQAIDWVPAPLALATHQSSVAGAASGPAVPFRSCVLRAIGYCTCTILVWAMPLR